MKRFWPSINRDPVVFAKGINPSIGYLCPVDELPFYPLFFSAIMIRNPIFQPWTWLDDHRPDSRGDVKRACQAMMGVKLRIRVPSIKTNVDNVDRGKLEFCHLQLLLPPYDCNRLGLLALTNRESVVPSSLIPFFASAVDDSKAVESELSMN